MKKIFWIAVVLSVALASYLLFGRTPDESPQPQNQTQNQTPNPPANNQTNRPVNGDPDPDVLPPATDEEDDETLAPVDDGNVWYGELQTSDKPTQGNLMLVLEETGKTIYINTARDYTDLIGQDVAVTYDGTIESFSLVDIKLK